MRTRMGWMVLLLLSVGLMTGCQHQTPEQKAQAKLASEQAAADKAAKKQAEADARAEQKRAEEQFKATMKAEQEQARAMKNQTPESVEIKAMERADFYPDDRLKVVGYPDFLPENHPTWLDKHAEAMVAAGATREATLYESDFQGNDLSPDGQSRLRLMMKNPPPTIFVATMAGNDAQKQVRFAAITKFWQDSTSKQIAVKEGVNEDVSMPANAGLSALQRLDKQAASPRNQSSGMSDTTLDNRSTSGAPVPGNP